MRIKWEGLAGSYLQGPLQLNSIICYLLKCAQAKKICVICSFLLKSESETIKIIGDISAVNTLYREITLNWRAGYKFIIKSLYILYFILFYV